MKTAYFILGMHRSGTSAIGGVLNLMGLEFGSDLMEAKEDNPKGFFENNLVYKLNKKILEESNSSWDDYYFTIDDVLLDRKATYIKEAKKIINSEYRFSQKFAIKDPRICMLFPIWEEACLDLNINVKVILPYRNPLEVAQSLKTRNNFSYEKTLLLWSNHFLQAEYLTRNLDRVFISFDELLYKTEESLNILETFIDFKLNEEISKKIFDFLDTKIKNSNLRLENFTEETPLFIQKTIQILSKKSFHDHQEIDFIRNEFFYLLRLLHDTEIRNILASYPKLEEKLQSEHQKYLLEKEDCERRISEVYEVYTKSKSEISEYESIIEKIELEKSNLNNLHLESLDSLQEVKEHNSKLEEFIEVYKEEKEDFNTIIEELSIDLKKKKELLDEEEKKFNREVSRLQELLQEQKREFEEKNNSLEELANRDKIALREKIKQLQELLQEQKKEFEENNNSLEELANREKIALKEKNKLVDDIKTLGVLQNNTTSNLHNFYLLQQKYLNNQKIIRWMKFLIKPRNKRVLIKKFNQVPLNFIENFNEKEYLKANEDVQMAIINKRFDNALEHFIFFGFNEVKEGKRKILLNSAYYQGDGLDYYSFLENFYQDANLIFNIKKPDTPKEIEGKKHSKKSILITTNNSDKRYLTIKESGLFDYKYYIDSYKVGEEKDLIEHYLHEGEKNGNKPNELFDPIWYLDNNEDVVRAEVSPFFHYIKYGEKEGREASSSFDPKWYLKIYDDVAKENISPMKHYLKYGKKEGRLQHKYTVANYNATDRKMNRLMPEWNENREEQFISSLEVASKDISNILVSIIMPTYNREETIKESILSVLNQSHKNFQLLIADDGSQDLTKEIIQEFDDDRINYFYQENKGVSAARNLGLKHAHGEYIFFLDSDNRWRTEYLNYMISFMETYQVEVAYSGMALTDDFVTYNGYLGQEYDYFSLQKRNYIDLNCFGYKNISKQYLFDETIGRLVDWDFILTIGLDRPMYYAPFIGVDYFTGDSHPRITNTVVTTDEEFITLKTYIQNKNFEYLASSEIVEIDKIAIVLHLFNNSNLNYFLELLKEIYYPFDLYITTTLSADNIIFEQFRSSYPLVTILEFIDYGSDIEAFLYLLPTLRQYKNILKLHNSNCDSIPFEMSKRIISEEIIPNLNSVLHSFETNPNLSIVGSKSLYLKEQLSEKEKFALNSIGSDKSLSDIECGYFVSSIFYMKSHRLLNLFKYTIDGVFKTKEFIKEDSRALMKNFIILSIAKNLNSEIGLIENNQVTINEYTDYLDLSLDEMLELESEEYLRFAPDIKKGKVFFSPDYRITNPYQKLMYESLDKYYNIEAGSIENALLEQEESEKNIIFHLQWTSFIVNGDNREEIEKKISYFLEKLQLFIQKGGKVIWTIHNLISHDNKFKDLEVELCQQLSELVHYVHVHSQEIEKLVKPFYSIPKDKIIVGEHGSYFNVYPNSITHEYARKKLKIKMDSFVFLFLGQVRPYKGVEALLAAFLELEKDEQTKKIELVIAGKPVNYDLTELEKLSSLSKNIHLELREIPDEELQLFFNVADFVVTPYKQILTSGSIYLALSYGIPVIAPKKGIISEVLEENKDSFLYDDNDSNALYKTMKKSLALPSYELEEFKNNALMKSKLLTWDNMHQKLSRVFISSIVNRVQFKTLKLINGVSREILIRERASSFSNSKLGIVILHYQHIEDTIRAIESVLEQKGVEYHLFVVSNDENLDAFIRLSKQFVDITMIQAPGNIGYAGGNNIALSLMVEDKAEYSLILNPDATIPSGQLALLYQKAIENPEVGIIGSTIVYGDRPNTIWFSGASIDFKNGLETEHIDIGKEYDNSRLEPFETDYVTGACILMKLDTLLKIGLIPEEYFLYFEETDYCLKASQQNISMKVFPDIKVLHFKRSEEGGIPSLYYLYYFSRNALVMTKKFNEAKVALTQKRIEEKAALWLKRIKSVSPQDLDKSQKAIEYGIKDGLNGRTGKVDLNVRLKL